MLRRSLISLLRFFDKKLLVAESTSYMQPTKSGYKYKNMSNPLFWYPCTDSCE